MATHVYQDPEPDNIILWLHRMKAGGRTGDPTGSLSASVAGCLAMVEKRIELIEHRVEVLMRHVAPPPQASDDEPKAGAKSRKTGPYGAIELKP